MNRSKILRWLLALGGFALIKQVLFSVYSGRGPFNPNANPPVDAALMTDIDNVLTGNLGIAKLLLATGSLTAISHFTGTGSGAAQTVSHGLGTTPTMVLPSYAGNFGSPPTHPVYWYNTTSTQVTIVADNGYFWHAIALAL